MQPPPLGGGGLVGSASGVQLSALGTANRSVSATTGGGGAIVDAGTIPPTTWSDAAGGIGMGASSSATQLQAKMAAAQVAQAAQAAAAAAAGVDARTGTVAGAGTSMYHSQAQAQAHGLGGTNGVVSASDEEAYRSAQMKRRKQLLDIKVEESRSQWVHPAGGQEETIIFHRVRALINLTGLSQIFICRLTSVTPASLSQYLRCNFKGRQDLLEDKLEIFINEYLNGKYDGNARRVQPGRRAIGRRSDQPGASAGANAALAATAHHHALMQRQAQAQAHAHAQAQAQAAQSYTQAQAHGQRVATRHSQSHSQYHQVGMYAQARYTQSQTHHLTAQQQQYMQHEYLYRQQQQQQQQAQLYQQALARQQQQARVAAAAAAAKAAAPPMKPLPPTVAVERAYHAYHSAVLDITSTSAEPLLVPIEIDVSVSEEEAKSVEAELKEADKRTKATAEKEGGKTAANEDGVPKENIAMDIDQLDCNKDTELPKTNESVGVNGEKKSSLNALMNAEDVAENSMAEKNSTQEVTEKSGIEDSTKAAETSAPKELEKKRDEGVEASTKVNESGDGEKKTVGEGSTKDSETTINESSEVKDLVNELLDAATEQGSDVTEEKAEEPGTRMSEENTQQESEKTGANITKKSDSTLDGTERLEGVSSSTCKDKDGDEVMGEMDDKEGREETEGQTDKEEDGKEKACNGDGDLTMIDVEKNNDCTKDEGETSDEEKEKTVGEVEEKQGESESCERLARELKYYTQWDVNERQLSPEEVAEEIVSARKVHPALKKAVAMAIRRQLFEVGVACAVPPSERNRENRRRIAIRVRLIEDDDQFLEDAFDWDICMGEYNSPELFAQYLCSDHGVSQYHVPQVACAIRRKVAIAQAIAYGDEETRKAAVKCLAADDPLIERLPPVTCGVRQLTRKEVRALAEKRVRTNVVDHVLRLVDREARRRDVKRKAEEKARILEEKERNRKHREEEAIRQAKEAEIKKIERKISMMSDRLCKEIGVGFIPYRNLKLARGVHPAVWTQGLLMRKQEGKDVLPFCKDATTAPLVEADKVDKSEKRASRRRSTNANAGDEANAGTTATPTPRKRTGRRGRPPASASANAGDSGTPAGTQRKRRASSRAGASTKRARK